MMSVWRVGVYFGFFSGYNADYVLRIQPPKALPIPKPLTGWTAVTPRSRSQKPSGGSGTQIQHAQEG